MQLAILHYHLNRGGVTQAILNHLEALATRPKAEQPEKVALVTCGRRDGWPNGNWQEQFPFECQRVVIPSLEYDATVGAEPEDLAEKILHGLREVDFDLAQTVLHTHNHALGKNASLPGALALLAKQGVRLLLQVHDFAEDFRPANYRHLMRSLRTRSAEELAAVLYPQGPGVHYATLTGRDQCLLNKAGVTPERRHVLPNPVPEFESLPAAADARGRVRDALNLKEDARLIVYPVRGIRRKNVGEMLLHSALAGDQACYAITLAPENPTERASFDRWQDLAERIDLNCRFDIGGTGGVPFMDALAAADAIVTTSVAEGFGMVFLETWLAGRPLVGRNLPEITGDFTDAGLGFPGLRDQLRVPLEWVDRDQLRAQLLELHSWACRDFNVAPPADTAEKLDAALAEGSIDFARLPTLLQTEVIAQVAKDREEALERVIACNPGFDPEAALFGAGQDETIAANGARVREAYSPEAVGERLSAVYDALMAEQPGGEVTPSSNGAEILRLFLQLDRMNPVRIEA